MNVSVFAIFTAGEVARRDWADGGGMAKKKHNRPFFTYIQAGVVVYIQHRGMEERTMFGALIKERRLQMGLSLRAFCQRFAEDPGNWSRMERGLLPPPLDSSRMHQIATYLAIPMDSEEFERLVDLAHADRGRVPESIMGDEKLVKLLPVMFRTIRKEPPTDDELFKLADKIREANNPQ